MNEFTHLFIFAVFTYLGVHLWLTARQEQHIRAHADQVPDEFADKIELNAHKKAADYNIANLQLERAQLWLGTILLLFWTLGGGIGWLDTLWQGSGLNPLWQGVGLLLSLALIGVILELPLSIWKTFGIESQFGFNRSSKTQFFKDFGLSILLTLVIGIPLLLLVLWLMQSAGNLWWLYVWAVWLGFVLLMTWLFPTVLAPLFNKFEPLEDETLKTRLENLLSKCGFRSNGLFVMDGSKRSSHGNAYFTGFGNNKRIVFFDTLLDGLEADELEAVLAHELGHFRKHHILKGLLFMAALSFIGLAVLGWLATQDWFYLGLGANRSTEALALALFMLAAPMFTFMLQPLNNWLSRKHEFEADAYAAEHSEAQKLISGLVKMYRDNASTLTPDALYVAFHHSHPPAPVRIAALSSKMGT